jgi:hypothetical protein
MVENGILNTQTMLGRRGQKRCDDRLEGCAHTKALGPLVLPRGNPFKYLVFVRTEKWLEVIGEISKKSHGAEFINTDRSLREHFVQRDACRPPVDTVSCHVLVT